MGNQVTMSEALIVTVVSMIVVFVVLVLISLMIGLLKNMGKDKVKTPPEPPKKEGKITKTDTIVKENLEEIEDEEELIAVITAAIAASLGVSVPQINISSIRRTNQNTNIWREVSKQEHLYGKL